MTWMDFQWKNQGVNYTTNEIAGNNVYQQINDYFIQ